MQTEYSIENQPSTRCILQQLIDCIDDPDPRFGIIGVYGLGGVGKTTLAKEVFYHFKFDARFDNVIMVTVSAAPNIQSIETYVRKHLDLYYTTKKFLLILDDVWPKFKIEDVRIPHPENHKGSKILVISRNQETCTDVGATKTIQVHPLSEAESWSLFIEVAGEHVTADDIKFFAWNIVGRCQGLPLAIVTVAQAMANQHGVGVWEDALRAMEQLTKELQGMKEEVFIPLKFCFDRLDDKFRSLFLYCACFPQDYNIGGDEMLNYCVGEGLADTLGSLKAARNKGEDLMESLGIACLLEFAEDKGMVRMPHMMRKLALWISSSSESDDSIPKFLIRTDGSFKEAPRVGETCRNLTTLLMRNNSTLTVIPPTIFLQHRNHLCVIDLSYARTLEYLPDSLSCLVNLRVLRLRECLSLRVLPELGMLRQLQVLDLYSCQMLDQQIFGPECVGGGSNLRYLNVESTNVSIPARVICGMQKLEELKMYKARKIKWRVSVEDVSNCGRRRVKKDKRVQRNWSSSDGHQPSFIDVGELSHLTYLTSLSISFEGITISDWFKPLASKITVLSLERCTDLNALQALNGSQHITDLFLSNCWGVKLPTGIKGHISESYGRWF